MYACAERRGPSVCLKGPCDNGELVFLDYYKEFIWKPAGLGPESSITPQWQTTLILRPCWKLLIRRLA
ncbi:hypothetical protein AALO_G00136430 [Alosa alosa]|uniref:Uncharacterized protein n=1 Tax=Alosa alosa TaxID=278164 RepID=A0AAV6GIZ0_9TELE|nr:hypothetical protein AALO_G00136430 [Alosa alosa]